MPLRSILPRPFTAAVLLFGVVAGTACSASPDDDPTASPTTPMTEASDDPGSPPDVAVEQLGFDDVDLTAPDPEPEATLSAWFGAPTGGGSLDVIGGPVRYVSWTGLGVAFAGGVFRNDGVEHLVGYAAGLGSPIPMRTPEGFAVGSTLAELRSVYADLTPYLPQCGPPYFSAQVGQPVNINGRPTWLGAEFAEVPVPDGPPSGFEQLPPGYEDTPVTAFEGGIYHLC